VVDRKGGRRKEEEGGRREEGGGGGRRREVEGGGGRKEEEGGRWSTHRREIVLGPSHVVSPPDDLDVLLVCPLPPLTSLYFVTSG
jgi:hypothetical protein